MNKQVFFQSVAYGEAKVPLETFNQIQIVVYSL